MPRQFDLCRTAAGTLVVVVQSDLLGDMATRVVIPLLPLSPSIRPAQRLNPIITVEGRPHILLTQQIDTVHARALGPALANAAAQRDAVIRAIDVLITGV